MANTALQAERPKFSVMINTTGYQKMINNTLKDPKKVQRFVSAITSAVAVNPALQECDPSTILSGALLGESLGLYHSPQLGHYYLVPYDNKKKGCKDAQFTMGYKGFLQLALRSGYYKRLNVISIKSGELIKWNPLTEEIDIHIIEDDKIREATPTIGYLASFEYLNGFTKTIYWSKEKMIAHADRYSPAFHADAVNSADIKKSRVSFADYESGNYPKTDEWKYSSFWYKNFDGMAFKTMIRQLISKWGVMSVELQQAYSCDDAIINSELEPEYMQPTDIQIADQKEFEPEREDTTSTEDIEYVSLDDIK